MLWTDDREIRARGRRSPGRRPLLQVSSLEAEAADRWSLTARGVTLGVVLILVAAALWTGLVGAGRALYSRNPRFTVRRVEIRGGSETAQRLIREYTGIREGTNLFAFSIAKIHRRVLSRAFAFRRLDIVRRLPDTVEIEVTERIPLARLDSPWNLVADAEGVVFCPLGRASHLPVLRGVPRSRLEPGRYLDGMSLAALHLLEACEDPSVGLDAKEVRVDASDRLTLIVTTAKGDLPVTCAWEGMGQNTPEARAALRQQLFLIREALASPQARTLSQLDATLKGRAYGR